MATIENDSISFPGVGRLSQGCNMYRCKEGVDVDSYRNKNGNIPPVRGVAGLPGAMSGCGATCTSRGLPGVVGTSRRSGVARWKAMISAVIVMYFYWTKSVGSANGGHVSVSVGQRRIFSAQWHSSRAYRHLSWYQSAYMQQT